MRNVNEYRRRRLILALNEAWLVWSKVVMPPLIVIGFFVWFAFVLADFLFPRV